MTAPRIAVVGMACRYPDATSPDELFETVLARRTAFRRIPLARLSPAYLGTRNDPDRTYASHAAVLRDWTFDRQRFGVPGPLHRAADHTHWLALETAAAALADAGFPDGEGLDRGNVGVILGNSLTGEFSRASMLRLRWPFVADAAATALADSGIGTEATAAVLRRLEELVKEPFPVPGDESLAGALANTIAGRICNHFDFHGTGYTVDGACSSSLLAVSTACRSLVSGECDFVLAGGVDMSLDPLELVGFARLGALAETEMRVYDTEPTGFLPGEGCGMVALMRADDAEAADLRIYAHIVGWASSSDGSGGLTRPERSGQALAMERAYRMSGVRPEQVGLIEGHGTGTPIGDQVELETLTSVRGVGTAPAALGSIKANIGHTKAAAGVAGLIKAAMATHRRVLPPTTGCREPHELLTRPDAPLRVLADAEPWTDRSRRAGVSSMGFGGINVHLVLEGSGAAAPPPALTAASRAWSSRVGQEEIVIIGAAAPGELAERLSRLTATARQLSTAEVRDLACSAWREHRPSLPFRAALVARTPDELATAAESAFAATPDWDGTPRFAENGRYALGGRAVLRLGLLFPGQAAPVRLRLPWWARRLDLPALPAELTRRAASVDTELAQPAIVHQSLAALAWLNQLGCTAVGACGHSLGELTALRWAGSYDSGTVLALAQLRGRLMAQFGETGTTMAGLAVSPAAAEGLLAATKAVLACNNGPQQTVVSGPESDIDEILDRARRAGIAASRLAVSHGFHSEAMLPAAGALRRALDDVPLSVPGPGLISTITGTALDRDLDAIRHLLAEQLTTPVRFSSAITELAKRCDLLIEAGPGTMLTGLAAANDIGIPALSLDSGGDPLRHAMTTAVLSACAGADLTPWFADRPHRTLPLDAEPAFVAGPCEVRTGWAEAGSIPATPVAPPVVAEPASATDSDPLTALTGHLAALLELPVAVITPSSSLLRDLHMTSLQVTDAVAAIATGLGRGLPSAPLSLSDATVADAAEVIAGLPKRDDEPARPAWAGVRGWVRQFAAEWVAFTTGKSRQTRKLRWSGHGPAGHWVHTLPSTEGQPDALAVLLGGTAPTELVDVLQRVAEHRPRHLVIIHSGHPAAAAVGRSIAAEVDDCSVVVLDVPDTDHPAELESLTAHPARYLELRMLADSSLERRVLRARTGNGPHPDDLSLDGVCLVTGGLRGIAAYAAAELGERTGCTLVFVGRTAADDPELTAALADLRGRVTAEYLRCDVTDRHSVSEMVMKAGRWGPIRGLIHGAGVNEPRRIEAITAESLTVTLGPKVAGLHALLDTVGDELRLLIGFGSIIGRQGLPGQAEYCIANDWMRGIIEQWARNHPQCRTHLLEWSVWSGLGMGVRLGVLDSLRRQGVEPIGPREGVAAMLDVLRDPRCPVSVLVTARFPATSTITIDGPDAPLLRFAERLHSRLPGVEAVTESELSLGSDPYLDDHRIDEVPVLPAVLALEAMAQGAALTVPPPRTWSLTNLQFRSPITVPVQGARKLQVAALAGPTGVEVVLRDDSDDFGTDRFSGTIRPAPEPPEPHPSAAAPGRLTGRHPFYGSVFFHSGRFARLVSYEVLTAFRVTAWVAADEQQSWFSAFHAQDLLLGDPGVHDATLHVLLACVPHRKALPVGVDRVTVWRTPKGILRVEAVEVTHTADDYVYDIDLVEASGAVAARWEGLRLRAISAPQAKPELPLALIGPWLTRRLIECSFADSIELVTEAGSRSGGAGVEVARRVTGTEAGHDPAGSLRVPGRCASASYVDNAVLIGLAPSPIGVDWERATPATLPHSLEPADEQAARVLSEKLGESSALTRLRLWTARESVVKLGLAQAEPLRVDQVSEDGIVVLSTGSVRVASARIGTTEGDVVMSVARGGEE